MLPSKSEVRFCTKRITPTMMVYCRLLKTAQIICCPQSQKNSVQKENYLKTLDKIRRVCLIFSSRFNVVCSLCLVSTFCVKPQQTIHSLKAKELNTTQIYSFEEKKIILSEQGLCLLKAVGPKIQFVSCWICPEESDEHHYNYVLYIFP